MTHDDDQREMLIRQNAGDLQSSQWLGQAQSGSLAFDYAREIQLLKERMGRIEKTARARDADVRMECARMVYSHAKAHGLSTETTIEEAQKLADFVLGGAS